MAPASSAPLHAVPSRDDGLALRFYPVVSSDGTRLRAWTNDVDGPTVVLCNGLGTSPYAWPALLDPGCGVRVISWNHRGTGGSARPADPDHVGIDAFAEDAIAVMDDAGVTSAVLMGWSMGVNTMYEVAVNHPERVLGLFAVGGVPGDTFAAMGAPLLIPRLLRKPITVNLARVFSKVGGPLTQVAKRLTVGRLTYDLLTHSGFMLPMPDPVIARRAIQEFLSTPVEWYMHLALHSSLHARARCAASRCRPASWPAGTTSWPPPTTCGRPPSASPARCGTSWRPRTSCRWSSPTRSTRRCSTCWSGSPTRAAG